MATIQLPTEFSELLKLVGAHEVNYLIVCGYAVAPTMPTRERRVTYTSGSSAARKTPQHAARGVASIRFAIAGSIAFFESGSNRTVGAPASAYRVVYERERC